MKPSEWTTPVPLSEVPQTNPVPPPLTGVASKERVLAAIGDSFLALLVGVATISILLKRESDVVQGSAFVAVYLAYYFLSEALFNATPGKLIFGLRVRQLNGERATWQQALIRTLSRIVEVNPILAGAIPAAIAIWTTQRRQRLGDLRAGTVVVKST